MYSKRHNSQETFSELLIHFWRQRRWTNRREPKHRQAEISLLPSSHSQWQIRHISLLSDKDDIWDSHLSAAVSPQLASMPVPMTTSCTKYASVNTVHGHSEPSSCTLCHMLFCCCCCFFLIFLDSQTNTSNCVVTGCSAPTQLRRSYPVSMYALRIVSLEKILHHGNTLIIISTIKKKSSSYQQKPDPPLRTHMTPTSYV